MSSALRIDFIIGCSSSGVRGRLYKVTETYEDIIVEHPLSISRDSGNWGKY
jgi:hypothetical protein